MKKKMKNDNEKEKTHLHEKVVDINKNQLRKMNVECGEKSMVLAI